MPTVRFQLRRDTAANWASVNPVLGDGEPAIETDTRRKKYGDGVTAWTSLPYDSPVISSGTYVPTLTGVSNVGSVSVAGARYSRIGDQVTVSGRITVTPTAANTRTDVNISLPIASNFGGGADCGGSAAAISGSPPVVAAGLIFSDAAADQARLAFIAPNNSVQTVTFTFQYSLLP